MVYRIVKQLQHDGLIPVGTPSFCGNFQRHIKLFFPPALRGKNGIFVKVSKEKGVEEEYSALGRIRGCFEDSIIPPLGLWKDGALTAVAYPLKELKRLSAADLAQSSVANQLERLFRRFASQDKAPLVDNCIGERELLSALGRQQATFGQSVLFADYVQASFAALRDISMPQHGDFTLNNLAIDESGGLVLLDWEDYGKVQVPYFDLATLLFSVAVAQGRVAEVADSPAALFSLPGSQVAVKICQAQAFSRDEFVRRYPFFLLLFGYLKSELGYGEFIVGQVRDFLGRVSLSKSWAAALG